MLLVTTKTGDAGTTGLANGERLAKDNLLFDVIGTLDELNAWLGKVVAGIISLETDYQHLSNQKKLLLTIQETLFVVGAEIAKSPKAKLSAKMLTELEVAAAMLQEQMAEGWHTKFVLPGGHPVAAELDLTRTVCRRCERLVIALGRHQEVAPVILKYLNRLSDYIYVLRCYVNVVCGLPEHHFIHNP